MVPIPVFWTEYTATVHGSRLKSVPCENCSTEYVYILQREAVGAGTSLYNLNNDDAAGHAKSAAGDTLQSVLENDFDPVPCPVCGHYQRYMFPKLLGNTGLGVRLLMFGVIGFGSLAAVNALQSTVAYLQYSGDGRFTTMVTAWSLLLLLVLGGLGLALVNKSIIRRFTPNAGDPQARLALARSRAVTRAEFTAQQAKDRADAAS